MTSHLNISIPDEHGAPFVVPTGEGSDLSHCSQNYHTIPPGNQRGYNNLICMPSGQTQNTHASMIVKHGFRFGCTEAGTSILDSGAVNFFRSETRYEPWQPVGQQWLTSHSEYTSCGENSMNSDSSTVRYLRFWSNGTLLPPTTPLATVQTFCTEIKAARDAFLWYGTAPPGPWYVWGNETITCTANCGGFGCDEI